MPLTSSITKFAYGWREEDVSGFDREMAAIKDHHISRRAFWMPYGPDQINSSQYGEVFFADTAQQKDATLVVARSNDSALPHDSRL